MEYCTWDWYCQKVCFDKVILFGIVDVHQIPVVLTTICL